MNNDKEKEDRMDRIEMEPVDRLTRIADAMSKAMQSHPEYRPTDKATILLDNDVEQRGGMLFHGYEDSLEALIDMLLHLGHMIRAHGIDVAEFN